MGGQLFCFVLTTRPAPSSPHAPSPSPTHAHLSLTTTMAEEKLAMSLDDIIKTTGRGRGRGRAANDRGRGWGRGFTDRRLSVSGGGVGRKPAPAAVRVVVPVHSAPPSATQALGGPGRPTTTLRVSNLNFRVTDQDVFELFSVVGPLAAARCDRDYKGQPAGTATVTFFDRGDALRAIKQYDGVLLDGRPLRLALDAPPATAVLSSGLSVTRPVHGGGNARVVAVTRPGGGVNMAAPRVLTVARPQGGARPNKNGRGGGGGGGARRARVKSRVVVASAADLDAQMDDYMGQGNKGA